MFHFRKPIFLLFSFFLIFSIFIVYPGKTESQVGGGGVASVKLYGHAWSSNIGWLSFNNCELDGEGGEICQGPTYFVSVNESDGTMTGHAWSSGVGWLQFGGLSQFPTGNGTVSANARINLTDGTVTGWIRACGATLNGDCTGGNHPDAGGWDGWISLSGADHPSPVTDGSGGVTYVSDAKRLVGKAWGGDRVIGWIDFVDVRVGIPPEPEPIDYNLINSTEGGDTLEIPLNGFGNVSVTRVYIDGGQESIELNPGSLSPSSNFITIHPPTNNPCDIPPDCSSTITIEVAQEADPGGYSFEVTGESVPNGVVRQTTVTFEVVEGSDPPPPTVSCEATGTFWVFHTVTWEAEVSLEETLGGELFSWSGSGGLECEGQPSEECKSVSKAYIFPGLKTATVTVFDAEGEEILGEASCVAPIGIGVFFKEF